MKLPLRFLAEAVEEIGETRLWYDNQRQGLGEEFLLQLNYSLVEVENRPMSFQLVDKTVRRAILKRFPYCIYFVIREHEFVVLAVLHGGRRPSAWKQRWTQ